MTERVTGGSPPVIFCVELSSVGAVEVVDVVNVVRVYSDTLFKNQIKSNMNRIILPILAFVGAFGSIAFMWSAYNLQCPTLSLFMVVISLILFSASCHQWEVELKKKEVDNG